MRRMSNAHASCSSGTAPANHLVRCRALLRQFYSLIMSLMHGNA